MQGRAGSGIGGTHIIKIARQQALLGRMNTGKICGFFHSQWLSRGIHVELNPKCLTIFLGTWRINQSEDSPPHQTARSCALKKPHMLKIRTALSDICCDYSCQNHIPVIWAEGIAANTNVAPRCLENCGPWEFDKLYCEGFLIQKPTGLNETTSK